MSKNLQHVIRTAKEYLMITSGALLTALGLNLFLVPNSIAAGGASGLGTVLYFGFGIPVSAVVLGVNVLLFVLGYKYLSKSVLVRTLFATFSLSAFIEIFSFLHPITDNLILASIYGGLCFGAGTGLTIANGGATGGSDLAAVIIHKQFRVFSIARLILFLDLFVIVLSGIVFSDFEVMLYAAVALYVASITADAIIEGVNFAKLVFIVSDKADDIAQEVMKKLDRGITALKGSGMYSGKDVRVLMCAVRRNQFVKLRSIIRSIDKNAFIILSDAREVIGNGFKIND